VSGGLRLGLLVGLFVEHPVQLILHRLCWFLSRSAGATLE
jgi:hypothetical protein